MLPKVVVRDADGRVTPDSTTSQNRGRASAAHPSAPQSLQADINRLMAKYTSVTEKEKSAIFADSLATRYNEAGKFDSAARFAEEAASFFNSVESWVKAGDQYYQGYSFAVDPSKRELLAENARRCYNKVLQANPANLDVKTKVAMTYLSSSNPMQGILMLREVLAQDPQNQEALFNLGMLSIQTGQYKNAVDRLEELTRLNPSHVQGHLLLGVALMNTGDKTRARQQFEKVKQMDSDPAVQATVDSYLKDLK